MRRVVCILLALAGVCIGATNEYVLPTRTDLNQHRMDYSLPLSTWTNTVSWLVGEPGATNLTDWSGEHADVALVDSGALAFDGTGDYVQANGSSLGAGDFYYHFTFKYMYEASSYLWADGDASIEGKWIALQYINDDELRITIDDDSTKVNHVVASNVPDDSYLSGYVKRESNIVSWGLTNLSTSAVYTGSVENTTDFSHTTDMIFGGALASGSLASAGQVEWVCFKAGASPEGLSRHYVFSETSGSTVYDVSGNGNHGTITTTSGLSTMRAARQDAHHWNINHGCATWTNGTNTVFVPYLSDESGPASTNVTGYALERLRPADVLHNGAETELTATGGISTNNALWASGGAYTNVSYADLIGSTNAVTTVETNASGAITEVYVESE